MRVPACNSMFLFVFLGCGVARYAVLGSQTLPSLHGNSCRLLQRTKGRIWSIGLGNFSSMFFNRGFCWTSFVCLTLFWSGRQCNFSKLAYPLFSPSAHVLGRPRFCLENCRLWVDSIVLHRELGLFCNILHLDFLFLAAYDFT